MTSPNPDRSTRGKPPRPTPPKLLDIARWLFILSAAVGLVRFVVQLADREMLIRELRSQQPNLSQDELDAAATGGIVFGLLIGVGMVLVYTLLANRMAGGRNWARVVLTIIATAGIFLGVLRLVAAVSGVTAAFGLAVSPVDLAFGVVTMLIDATAVALMYQASVSGHFRSVRSVSRRPPPVANGL
ncbi:hypothetical protein FHX81_4759 [Saccharothrix saharensis]|uniref:Uncharacterized protein n=1 Tax=Saccharothrix saharensis TaxID=571190 RepID=A0A543JHS9_9PSEU|nr:hypothetical protein [Saccharothrix saharensis]TQM82355.1 hypothetical protein FHX81_4759 [Saccharothrix saharensis]